MIFTIILIGFFATVLGALAPGASNIVVVKTTIDKGMQNAFPIIYGAGLGEIVVAFIAWYFGVMVASFFTANVWVQISVMSAIAIAGIVLFNKKASAKKTSVSTNSNAYLSGFLLSAINPPVLLYWVVVFTVLQKFDVSVSNNYSILFIFMVAVFFGKVLTLMGYALLGMRLEQKATKPEKLNRVLGIILLLVASVQAGNFLLS